MNKEQYIKDRETGAIDFDGAYEMYLGKQPGVPKIGKDQFIGLFSHWIRHTRPYVEEYFAYWDERFEIKEKGEEI